MIWASQEMLRGLERRPEADYGKQAFRLHERPTLIGDKRSMSASTGHRHRAETQAPAAN
jgi:hypothetical protein